MGQYVIAGGSGFIGRHLTKLLLNEGHTVYNLSTRKRKNKEKNCHYIHWLPSENFIDDSFNMGECILINLAGAGVADKRWTEQRKKEIINSRIQSIEFLYKLIEQQKINPQHIVSASAIGYYGMRDEICTETTAGDSTFLSTTCQQWEQSARKFSKLGISLSIIRIGIVFGIDGGAIKELIQSFRFGVSAIPSDGKQIYSWIHIDDIVSMIYFLAKEKKDGIYNGVAPQYETVNRLFFEIRKHKKSFLQLHIPDIIMKIILGEMAVEILKSTKVNSEKIVLSGFVFQYPSIDLAIEKILTRQ